MNYPAMKYTKSEAKAYARANFKGVWAAVLTPFDAELRVDEDGFRANIKHWFETLKIAGLFVAGKQAEFFSMSIEERKRQMKIAVEMAAVSPVKVKPGIITSCSDTNLDVVLELARYSQTIGADYIVVHSPVLHFGANTDETIYEYYRYLSEQLEIGIALWNHPDCGYIMSPELCNRIADLPNIVAIKYSVPRETYAKLTRLAGDRILVSNPDEHDWLENIIELGWQLYLCSNPPYLLQTAVDQRINEYTALAFAGKYDKARKVSASLEPAREALKTSRPHGKPQAHAKYWQDLLGQVGGPVRRPLLQMTDADRAATQKALNACGLKVS
jgi:4-hydroxy-tetrahydrodipicolinate synthase